MAINSSQLTTEAMLSASQNFSAMGLGGVTVSSTTNAENKERAYVEKIKTLKAENKKLIGLLKDSEKLFIQKLKETKKESENLSQLFKQLWPLIKHKVKDPNGLLKTVNGFGSGSNAETPEHDNSKTEEIEELKQEIEYLRQQEKKLVEDLKVERE